MKALLVRVFGPPEALELCEVPTPEPGPGEALVRIRACGVCYHDVLDRAGKLPNVRPPIILGHEIAGDIAALGPYAGDLRVGQRVAVLERSFCGVCAYCVAGQQSHCRRGEGLLGSDRDGGYAEYIRVPARTLVPIPDALSYEVASLLSCVAGTIYRAVRELAQVRLGEQVLVTGAGGGLGLMGVQLARLVGARVIAVTSSPGKAAAVRAAGADEVVVSPDLRFAGAVWELSGRRGVDVVLDTVVSATFEEALRSMAQGGRYALIGNVEARTLPFNPGLVIGRRLRIIGASSANLADLRALVDLAARGAIRLPLAATAPLAEAAAVHRAMEARQLVGRTVLIP